MNKRSLVCTILGLALALTSAFGQSQYFAPGNIGGGSDVQQFAQWSSHTTNTITSGANALSLDNCYFALGAAQQQFFPLAVGVKVTVLDAASETVAITAVNSPTLSSGSAQPGFGCGFSATFSNAHSAGAKVISGDGGMGEAVTVLKGFGGNVYITSLSGITSAQIAALTVGAFNVYFTDVSGANAPNPQSYFWNGAGYQPSAGANTLNGAGLSPFTCDFNVTLSLVATTTAVGTASTCVPANAFILGVTGRVTTTITGACTGWSVGDAGTAARFIINNTGLTAGTKATNTGTYQTTAIAVAATGVSSQSTGAEALQITCAGGNPTAGVIRVTAVGFATVPSGQ